MYVRKYLESDVLPSRLKYNMIRADGPPNVATSRILDGGRHILRGGTLGPDVNVTEDLSRDGIRPRNLE